MEKYVGQAKEYVPVLPKPAGYLQEGFHDGAHYLDDFLKVSAIFVSQPYQLRSWISSYKKKNPFI